MLIACKCLNIISSTGHKNAASIQSNKILESIPLANFEELQKNPKIHSDCLEFLKSAIGPISDLTTTINQNDLVFKVPIEPWYLHYCINCNKITHAKHNTNAIYLINSNLLTNNEEINSLKANKSYSFAFGILIIDHQPTTPNLILQQGNNTSNNIIGGNSNNQIGGGGDTIFHFNRNNSISNNSNDLINNQFNQQQQNKLSKQQIRLRGLNSMLQNRLQKEIQDTNERIRRYTEQQFTLLKIYREKTEQEYQILVSLVNQVPEQLKIIEAIDSLTTTKSDGIRMANESDSSSRNNSGNNGTTIIDNNTTQQQQSSLFTFKQQQVSNLDTPPATPDSTPMSVGNSPTFRQQTTVYGGNNIQRNGNLIGAVGNQNPPIDDSGDCLFELEGLENYPASALNSMSDVEETEDAEDALGDLESAVPISRMANRRGSLNMAKSLPISIANNFMANNVSSGDGTGGNGATGGKFNYADLEDEATEDSAVDIAASIKALAKSVHGDTIFGDLPRPRFSTQI